MSQGILASTTSDQEEVEEMGESMPASGPRRPLGSLGQPRAGAPVALDQEAIRLTDTFLQQGREEEGDTQTTNTPSAAPAKVLKVPGKSILKKPVAPAQPSGKDSASEGLTQETCESQATMKAPGGLKAQGSKQPGGCGQASPSHTQPFYPAQPAVLARPAPRLEMHHAQQKLVVNAPLSPPAQRRETVAKPPGPVSPLAQRREAAAKPTDPVSAFSLLSGQSLGTCDPTGKGSDSKLKSALDRLDTKHGDNMKKINDNFEEDVKRQHDVVKPQKTETVIKTSQTKPKEVTPVKPKPGPVPVGGDRVAVETARPQATSLLKNVTTECKKLDDVHSVHMKQIEANFKDQDIQSRQPPTTDHHSSRPETLGRSRFDCSPTGRPNASEAVDSLRTKFPMEHHVPRRNETVHDLPSLNTTSAPPTSTGCQSPDMALSRKKFDRNFNASPEPFLVSKSKSQALPSSVSPCPTSAATPIRRPSFADRPAAKSPPERSYSPPRQFSTPYSTSSSSLASSNAYSLSSTTTFSSPYSYNSSQTYNSSYSYSPPASSTFPSPANFTPSLPSAAAYQPPTPSPAARIDRTSYDSVLASSRSAGDLQARIQATKDQHKLDIKKAMDFDRTALKPPIICQKLPRPEPGKYSGLGSSSAPGMTVEREARRMAREHAVLDRVLGDRASRGKSDDFLTKTSSYRL
jgi:hypothetical protein